MKNQLKQCDLDGVGRLTEEILQEPLYKPIIESEAFQRLKNISFLGAIDYVYAPFDLTKIERTRFFHSLSVAALAKHVSQLRGYSKDLEQNLIATALIHDIGHLPLSHSIEPLIKSKLGASHHELGLSIIQGECALGFKLSRYLKAKFDFNLILGLSNRSLQQEFSDIFYSPINIDTIDGIIRSSRYVKKAPKYLSPLDVATSAFVDNHPDRHQILDDFWILKQFVYRDFILGDIGIKADFISQKYFERNESQLTKVNLSGCEKALKKLEPVLFDTLAQFKKKRKVDTLNESETVKIIKREYVVNEDSSKIESRYTCNKHLVNYTIKNYTDVFGSFVSQLHLAF
jgi:hypothetical protein